MSGDAEIFRSAIGGDPIGEARRRLLRSLFAQSRIYKTEKQGPSAPWGGQGGGEAQGKHLTYAHTPHPSKINALKNTSPNLPPPPPSTGRMMRT